MPPDAVIASRRAAVLKLLALVALVAAAALVASHAGLFDERRAGELVARVRALRDRPAAPALFVALYALASALGLPATVLTLAGGAVFGVGRGLVLNWLGAMLGALGAFVLARSLGRDAVRRLLGRRRAKALDRLAAAHGRATLFRLRVIPVVPFAVLNFGSGISGIAPRDYLVATAFGILPANFVYTYSADALVAGAGGAREEALVRVAIAAALLVALSFLPTLARRFGLTT
jgi:uncharacterized membrane protein YdjX (TVP38/TMEM64 family)